MELMLAQLIANGSVKCRALLAKNKNLLLHQNLTASSNLLVFFVVDLNSFEFN
jgi:hypothetical protein